MVYVPQQKEAMKSKYIYFTIHAVFAYLYYLFYNSVPALHVIGGHLDPCRYDLHEHAYTQNWVSMKNKAKIWF